MICGATVIVDSRSCRRRPNSIGPGSGSTPSAVSNIPMSDKEPRMCVRMVTETRSAARVLTNTTRVDQQRATGDVPRVGRLISINSRSSPGGGHGGLDHVFGRALLSGKRFGPSSA